MLVTGLARPEPDSWPAFRFRLRAKQLTCVFWPHRVVFFIFSSLSVVFSEKKAKLSKAKTIESPPSRFSSATSGGGGGAATPRHLTTTTVVEDGDKQKARLLRDGLLRGGCVVSGRDSVSV